MSEVKLNLIDAQQILHGTIHGSVADATVAALSAEPETIAELSAALDRYHKRLDQYSHFAWFRPTSSIDEEPWDAGLVIIDLAARIVATESSYSKPHAEGQVNYHDGVQATDILVPYRAPDDWLFVDSIEEYNVRHESRKQERAARPPRDERAVLFGRPLLEWLVTAVRDRHEVIGQLVRSLGGDNLDRKLNEAERKLTKKEFEGLHANISQELSAIHSRWLMTPREDLGGQSPRDVLFAKQDFIDYDLHTRSLQWSLQGEGPPCLAQDSFAYRFAGFGTHEWVIYYDLVRHLLWTALNNQTVDGGGLFPLSDIESKIAQLDEARTAWLERPESDYDGKIPAILIDNERKRLPIAMSPRDVIIDDDCPLCQMMAEETTLGNPTFWHLDGSHMDDEFAFSYFRTHEEWEEEQRSREEFSKKFNGEWEERQQRIARGEPVEPISNWYVNERLLTPESDES
jgi:hypothetical protein